LGLHYTHVGVDGEPAQLTQFVTAMIATAFVEDDVQRILEAGLAAVDSQSIIHRVATEVTRWTEVNPDAWQTTRRNIRDRYTQYAGHEMRIARNGRRHIWSMPLPIHLGLVRRSCLD
jgi:hypothetical protein